MTSLNFYTGSTTYEAPAVGGEITGVSGFTMFTPPGDPYTFPVPDAVGSVDFTFSPGVAGNYTIQTLWDVEIDEWINTYFNESGGSVGTPASGPAFSQSGAANDDAGDIYWTMDYALQFVGDDNYALINFLISDTAPTSGFYLTQTDNTTNETFYFSSDITVVPEPATMVLLGTGLVGLAGLARRKFKK